MSAVFILISTILSCIFIQHSISEYASTFENKRLLDEESDEYIQIAVLKQEAEQLRHLVATISSTGPGVTFTRWGRTVCPNNTNLVYSGFVGGSHYTHSGGAANYLCLPSDPTVNGKAPSSSSNYLYGAEFETNDFGSHSQDEDVTCAVCWSPMATSSLMIPARNVCYPGWTTAYSGLLAAGYYGHASASEYVCVDGIPQYEPHGQSNQNGKLFYPVTAHCGSLSCPPYKENMELECVVCVK